MHGWEGTRGNGEAHLVLLQCCVKGASGIRAAGCLGQRGPAALFGSSCLSKSPLDSKQAVPMLCLLQ